jgi:hypothetical protein
MEGRANEVLVDMKVVTRSTRLLECMAIHVLCCAVLCAMLCCVCCAVLSSHIGVLI